jgi:hypothetical protein
VCYEILPADDLKELNTLPDYSVGTKNTETKEWNYKNFIRQNKTDNTEFSWVHHLSKMRQELLWKTTNIQPNIFQGPNKFLPILIEIIITRIRFES